MTWKRNRSSHALGSLRRDGPLLVVCILILAAPPGCGDERPRRVPVSGRVLIDGKPLTTGYIRLVPKGARPAEGTIGPDGRFTLTTFEPNDGAVIGRHVVSVDAAEVLSDTARCWRAPKKYADPKTSGLTATIDGPTDSLLIELTWDGQEPFVETDQAGM